MNGTILLKKSYLTYLFSKFQDTIVRIIVALQSLLKEIILFSCKVIFRRFKMSYFHPEYIEKALSILSSVHTCAYAFFLSDSIKLSLNKLHIKYVD